MVMMSPKTAETRPHSPRRMLPTVAIPNGDGAGGGRGKHDDDGVVDDEGVSSAMAC